MVKTSQGVSRVRSVPCIVGVTPGLCCPHVALQRARSAHVFVMAEARLASPEAKARSSVRGSRSLSDEGAYGADNSSEGDMFDTGGDDLADGVERPLWSSENHWRKVETRRQPERRPTSRTPSSVSCLGTGVVVYAGKITPDEVPNDNDVGRIAVLGVHLSQYISLSQPCDSNEVFNAVINQKTTDFLTLECDALLQVVCQNMCTGIAGHTSNLDIEDAHAGSHMI